MPYNRFTIYLILRIILILLTLMSISYLFNRGDLFYTLVFVSTLLVVQVILLIQFVNKTNSELSKFILALRNTDYTTKFPKAENESFALLYERFQITLDLYKKKEAKYEAQYLFIQELIDNIETGLLAFDEKNKVVVINRVARNFRADFRFEDNRSLISVLENLEDSQIIEGQSQSGQKVELLINKSTFKLFDQPQTIFTFKDISSPLETKEIESWQKLIRILAHEIINSLTPITSLSDTTLIILKNSTHYNELADIELSLKTIKDRSEGLLKFMEDYRRLVKVPPPTPELFKIKERMAGILHLFKTQLTEVEISESYFQEEIYADPVLFEQLIVNLLTNSIQAMEAKPNKKIDVLFESMGNMSCLTIRDNGCGMDADTLSKAFVPFYTTKNTGSGIGLSLIQQIVNLHQGKVEIESILNEYTAIRILLPVYKMNL
ncbi:MAG: ATP-binding protein [Reichenbachiella sp.]|uniref:sensor histidine kinase n=1 Tax=Reichenbachiella sp. TaxID=2184521 RepID=UPI00326660D7